MNIHIQNEPKITRVLFTTNHVDMDSYPNEWAQEIVKRVNEYEGRELAIKALDEENDQLVKQVDDLQKENEQLNDKVIEIGELAFKVIENISKENVKLQEQNRELAEKLRVNIEDFADYLIENASVAFEHQDRELLENAIKRYFVKDILRRLSDE